jgi:predicted glycosyltransferase
MKLLFDVGHPAHVHLFKHVILGLTNKGHEVKITARDKDIVIDLLDSYEFDYTIISKKGKGLLGLGRETLIRDYRLSKIARNFKPDIMMAVHGGSWSFNNTCWEIVEDTFDHFYGHRTCNLS